MTIKGYVKSINSGERSYSITMEATTGTLTVNLTSKEFQELRPEIDKLLLVQISKNSPVQ